MKRKTAVLVSIFAGALALQSVSGSPAVPSALAADVDIAEADPGWPQMFDELGVFRIVQGRV